MRQLEMLSLVRHTAGHMQDVACGESLGVCEREYGTVS